METNSRTETGVRTYSTEKPALKAPGLSRTRSLLPIGIYSLLKSDDSYQGTPSEVAEKLTCFLPEMS